CFAINLQYENKWRGCKDRKFGGGVAGSCDSDGEAPADVDGNQLPRNQSNVAGRGSHKGRHFADPGEPGQPVLIYMSGSKFKVSKEWKSAIRLKSPNADRFASVWTLSSANEKNRSGQPYQNFKIDFAGWAPAELYAAAKSAYEGITGNATTLH